MTEFLEKNFLGNSNRVISGSRLLGSLRRYSPLLYISICSTRFCESDAWNVFICMAVNPCTVW
jgi:hypothetical protein